MIESPLVPTLNSDCDIAAERAKFFLQIVERFLGLINRPSELLLIENDLGIASGADHVVIRLKPSNALLESLAAFRAMNVDF